MEFELPLGISARHCHVTREDLDVLYGKGYHLTVRKIIKQPGQFASNEKVRFVTEHGEFNLSIIGPCRSYTQIEISATDARALGIEAPLRNSGDIENSPGGKLIGPKGTLELKKGAVVILRHAHMSPVSAARYLLEDGDRVTLKIEGERSAILENVLVRATPSDYDEVHMDTDEANAVGLGLKDHSMIKVITQDDAKRIERFSKEAAAQAEQKQEEEAVIAQLQKQAEDMAAHVNALIMAKKAPKQKVKTEKVAAKPETSAKPAKAVKKAVKAKKTTKK
ncbi:MAG: phosphate propanoyltransferase [Acidaminococcaceae bacterium]|nr:phosphate propanoyltransferase [Acidaminococcaceae bacterium]